MFGLKGKKSKDGSDKAPEIIGGPPPKAVKSPAAAPPAPKAPEKSGGGDSEKKERGGCEEAVKTVGVLTLVFVLGTGSLIAASVGVPGIASLGKGRAASDPDGKTAMVRGGQNPGVNILGNQGPPKGCYESIMTAAIKSQDGLISVVGNRTLHEYRRMNVELDPNGQAVALEAFPANMRNDGSNPDFIFCNPRNLPTSVLANWPTPTPMSPSLNPGR